jgi:hypothetical protein
MFCPSLNVYPFSNHHYLGSTLSTVFVCALFPIFLAIVIRGGDPGIALLAHPQEGNTPDFLYPYHRRSHHSLPQLLSDWCRLEPTSTTPAREPKLFCGNLTFHLEFLADD